MAGEANDAVPSYTQVQMKGAPRLLKLSETERPTNWIRLPRNRRPGKWDKIDDPGLPVESNVYSHPLAGLLLEFKLEELLLRENWGKFGNACTTIARET